MTAPALPLLAVLARVALRVAVDEATPSVTPPVGVRQDRVLGDPCRPVVRDLAAHPPSRTSTHEEAVAGSTSATAEESDGVHGTLDPAAA